MIKAKKSVIVGLCALMAASTLFMSCSGKKEADGKTKKGTENAPGWTLNKNDPITFTGTLPWIFFVILPVIGLGSSLIHMCSFPLVTDYCTSDKLGKFNNFSASSTDKNFITFLLSSTV